MNEKLQYASMLEIPESSCNVTVKPIKKKRVKRKVVTPEQVKQELMDKVNAEANSAPVEEQKSTSVESVSFPSTEKLEEKEQKATATVNKKEKKTFKFSVISLQLAVVVLLIGVIALTNVLNDNSGINVFMRSLFSPTTPVAVDDREFNAFTPVIAFDEGVTLSESGVLTVSGEGSVYSPCDGVVSSVVASEDGSYTVEIAHSENFSTLISGLTYVYMMQGEKVYANIPVGYMSEFEASLCFLGANGAVITGYEIIDGAVVWAV